MEIITQIGIMSTTLYNNFNNWYNASSIRTQRTLKFLALVYGSILALVLGSETCYEVVHLSDKWFGNMSYGVGVICLVIIGGVCYIASDPALDDIDDDNNQGF